MGLRGESRRVGLAFSDQPVLSVPYCDERWTGCWVAPYVFAVIELNIGVETGEGTVLPLVYMMATR